MLARFVITSETRTASKMGLAAEFAPEIVAAAVEAGTETIWIQTDYYNDLSVAIQNKENIKVDLQMDIIVEDVIYWKAGSYKFICSCC